MKINELQQKVKSLIEHKGVLKQKLAEKMGKSPAELSVLLNGNFEGELLLALKLLKNWK